jgi:hypothetical protein
VVDPDLSDDVRRMSFANGLSANLDTSTHSPSSIP